MSLRMRGNGRLLAVVALAALVLSTAGTLWADSTGREFSRCIQSCNDARRACRDRCAEDCANLFPNSNPDENECRATCRDECVIESDDCKLVCENIKEPPSPEEP